MHEDEMEQPKSASPIPPDHRLPPPQEPPPPPRKSRTWIWIVLLLVFALLFFLILRRHDQKNAQHAGAPGGRRGFGGPVSLTTATATQGDIGVYLDAIGTVTPVYTTQLTSQVTGVITQVHYREGQMVHKGDPLIDIDPRQYQAQLLQAQGALERDQNLLAQARMDAERYEAAWKRNAIARQQYEDQQKIVLQDEGTVKNDQGTVQYDQVQLSYCHITSPITGRAGLRLVDPGNLVTAGSTTPLVVVTQIEPITVIFTIPEDSLGEVMTQVRHGSKLSVDAYDRAQQTKIGSGRLMTVDNLIDTTTGTVKLRAQFDNKNDALFPNQFVNTKLLVNTLHQQTLIPSSAVQHNGDIAFVYLIEDGAKGKTAKMQNVKTGVSDAGMTAVQGIQPGQQVANSSFEKLMNGAQVVISKTPLPENPSETTAP
jgi:multidrug efflux system membrane fusion protein